MTIIQSSAASQADTVLAELRRALPADAISTDPTDIARHSSDQTGVVPVEPAAVLVHPASTAEVQQVMRIASSAGVPVTLFGAGTGLSGAATATPGGIVLSTSRLNRILEVNPTDQLAVVQPGVITDDLSRAAIEAGVWYAPDPASSKISTIGGNIATDAGGLHCVKYGVTGQSVLALEVVLADGRVIRTGHRSLKGVTGLDLTSLFVGSEGTLGVITEATLRLRQIPAEARTMIAWLPDLAEAGRVVQAIATSGVQPSALELLDHGSLINMDDNRGTDLARRGDSLLIIQTDGDDADGQRRRLVDALSGLRARLEVLDQQQADWYIEQRRAPRLTPPGSCAIKEDIAVPASQLVALLEGSQRLAADHGVHFECLAHAGDGNVHAKLLAEATPDGSLPQSLRDAADELVRLALELGGTITGEHGVGLLKRRWLATELGADQLEIQRQIKAVFDPRGILSPASFLATEEA